MREGDTRLVDAARHGRANDVAALLAGGADVNEQNSDGLSSTPLIIACQEGHTEIVKKLLAAKGGAPKSRRVPDGTAPQSWRREYCTRVRFFHGTLLGYLIPAPRQL